MKFVTANLTKKLIITKKEEWWHLQNQWLKINKDVYKRQAFDSSSLKQIRFIKEYFHLKDDDRSIRITSDNIDDFFLTHYDNLDIDVYKRQRYKWNDN